MTIFRRPMFGLIGKGGRLHGWPGRRESGTAQGPSFKLIFDFDLEI